MTCISTVHTDIIYLKINSLYQTVPDGKCLNSICKGCCHQFLKKGTCKISIKPSCSYSSPAVFICLEVILRLPKIFLMPSNYQNVFMYQRVTVRNTDVVK
jgi:hypothetical protein